MSEEEVRYFRLVRRDSGEALADALFRLGRIKAVANAVLEAVEGSEAKLLPSRPFVQTLRDIVALVDGKGGGE